MASKLKNIVIAQIGSRSAEIEKVVYKHQNIAGDIEKQLDDKKINIDEAMKKMRASFSYHLSDADYSKIEKEVRYNV